jgi:molecular chaperone HscB
MSSPSTLPTIQMCRSCGGGAPVDAHFCPQCTKILTLGRQGDYFAFLGVPRRLQLDVTDLERRFRTLSRQFHPDYFYNAPAAERLASLERSSYLNDAYRTLRDPAARVEYLLEVEGFAPAASSATSAGAASKEVPPSLLEEVFALNEELDEVREMRAGGAAADTIAARLERARQPIEQKRREHEQQLQQLSAEWDVLLDRQGGNEPPQGSNEDRQGGSDERRRVLAALRQRMMERNYITNLLAGIEREQTR